MVILRPMKMTAICVQAFIYSVLVSILGALHVFSCTTTLEVRSYHFHFAEEKIELLRLISLPEKNRAHKSQNGTQIHWSVGHFYILLMASDFTMSFCLARREIARKGVVAVRGTGLPYRSYCMTWIRASNNMVVEPEG